MADELSILNPSPKRLAGPALLHQLVARGAQGRSLAIEYQGPDKQRIALTYDELHTRADRLAAVILKANKHHDDVPARRFIVPLLIPQCPELYVAQLAILKAGGAFCPLPIDAPEDRLRFILQDVGASVVLTTSNLRSRIPSVDDVAMVIVDDHHADVKLDNAVVHVDPQATAYVMYTSGSTGLPKGVLISHAAATQALLAHDRHIPSFSRFLQVAAPTFDVSVFEIFFTLFRACTLVCCERTLLLADLPGIINALQVDATELTPSVASNLLGSRENVPGLKLLLTIGEMLKRSVVDEYGGLDSNEGILWGMYGPTEATIHCTLQPDFHSIMSVGNIGIPLDTVSAFVLKPVPSDSGPNDATIEILPLTEEGELAVGGHQLADEYLNREEQTKAAFVPHPRYGRLYRTGDRAKFTRDGRIECLGRISGGQVKLRGQRVELGEIEYAASKTQGCKGAVAEVIDNSLVLFAWCDSGVTSEADIRATCRKWLPVYMVPSEICLEDDLPYLASGKVDRKTLRQRFTERQEQAEPAQEPSIDARMEEITTIMRGILGAHAVRGADLALSGIDSLTAIRIASTFGKKGFPQPMATQIMEARTVSDVAGLLEHSSASTENADGLTSAKLIRKRQEEEVRLHPLISDQMDQVESILPCSAVQTAMLSESTLDPQRYCNWIELAISQSYNLEDIERAIDRLYQHHQLLRAGFVTTTGSSSGFAAVIWRVRTRNQIQQVHTFAHDLKIASPRDLLRPCKFQIRQCGKEVRILLQIHHALYDQWSIDVLTHDLGELLQAHQVHPTPFSSVLQYYAEHVESALSAESLDFWREHLRSADPVIFPNLNSLKVESAQLRTPWRPLKIKPSSLDHLTSKREWSKQAVFQASFAYLLSSYLATNDLVYGTVFSGRHIPVSGIDRAFGPCLTTLPVRLVVSTSDTWAHLVDAVHCTNREMLKHSEVPLSQIKRAADILPNFALFDALFVWPDSTVRPTGDDILHETDSADHHEFNLVLELQPRADSFNIRLTYQASLLPPEQADRMMEQIEVITRLILDEPASTIDHLDHILPQRLLSIANPRPTMEAASLDLAHELERVLVDQASQPAIMFAEHISDNPADIQSLSYGDLHSRANQLGRHLLSLDIQCDDLICICMEKSIDLYVAILACVKAGAGYLPLVPDTKKQRVESILQQARVKLVLSDDSAAHLFDTTDEQVLIPPLIDLERYPKHPLAIRSKDTDVAYTVFTSGSTGIPKGVVVTRGNLLGNLIVLRNLYPHSTGDRLLQACLQSFDVSVFEIFFSFLTGMTLCTATKDVLFADMEQSIRCFNITHLSMTPTVAGLVNPRNTPSVQFLVTAGEAITAAVHNKWAANGLYQGYGPSETTNICTVNPKVSQSHHLGSIGPPFSNTSAFVIDPSDDLKILPQGAFGEFAFGGEQVFRGYLGLDDVNKKKILNHPEYGRIYRSGDLGRILHDGSLLIHGRADDQTKIRGNRIELGEINATVLRDSSIDDCVTTVQDQANGERVLVSFWKPNASTETGVEIIKPADGIEKQIVSIFERLENSLPAYMIPTFLVPLTNVPRTGQGKLDKKQLNALFDAQGTDTRAHFSRVAGDVDKYATVSPTEDTLVNTLVDSFGLSKSQIDRHTSLFSFGINSINAIGYAKNIEKSLEKQVSISTVLRNPTVARLARAIDDDKKESSEPRTFNLQVFSKDVLDHVRQEVERDGPKASAILPCTPLQEAMLVSTSGAKQGYRNSTTFKINGDIDRLKSCFEAVVSRHAIMRATFVETDQPDRPYAQVIREKISLPWTEIGFDSTADGSHSTSSDTASEAVTPRTPVHFEVHQSGNATLLTLHMHHATYDGTSFAIVLDEVEALYRGHTLSSAPSLDPFLIECVRQSGTEAKEFWSRKFQTYHPTPFPSLGNQGLSEERRTNMSLSTDFPRIESFCRENSVSISSLIQAAWAKCLSELQDVEDICFGDVVNGRLPQIEGADSLVAPCFNTIPVRADLRRAASNLDLIRQMDKSRQTTAAYQLTPLRQIQKFSKRPDLHLFDSLLLLQPPEQELDRAIWEFESEQGDMGFPLVLEIVPECDSLELTVHYLADKVSESDASVVAEMFVRSVQSCLEHPDQKARDLSDFSARKTCGLLRSPDSQSRSQVDASEAPTSDEQWTATESTVRDVLSEVSRIDAARIKKKTSIYQLGLDSLNAAQIAARIRKHGYTIDLADIMEQQTLFAISRVIESPAAQSEPSRPSFDFAAFEKTHWAAISKSLNLPNEAIESIRPCTPVQCGMIAQSIGSSGQHYVNHIAFEVPPATSVDEIKRAWSAVQSRHPALRTGFFQTHDQSRPFAMLIRDRSAAKLPLETSSAAEGDGSESSIAARIVQSLDVPAWKVSIFLQQDQKTMRFSIHHALYDAESLHILLLDFAKALRGSSLGPSYNLDSLLAAILDTSTESDKTDEIFWKESLQAAPTSPFPSLTPRVCGTTTLRELRHESSLSTSDLETLCRSQKCTIQAAGQAAWARLLSSYLGEDDVVFGTVFSNRSTADVDYVVFPCINTVPVRARIMAAENNLLERMVNFNAAMQRHRFTPLSAIQRYAGDSSRSLFDTTFVYQKSPSQSDAAFAWRIVSQSAAVDYKVSLELETPVDGNVMLILTYMDSILPREHADVLLKQFEHLLAAELQSQASNATAESQLLSIIRPKHQGLPSPVTLMHEFVEHRAQETPDQPALHFLWTLDESDKQHRVWTYRQLDDMANRVAHLIAQNGAKPGDIVALCMDKCPEASFAFVGILKAGCSFLALDPELPEARKEFILEDSSASILLTGLGTERLDVESNAKMLKLSVSALENVQATKPRQARIDPQSTCYCLYTSGTTGTPKGCEISHENAVQAMMAFQRLFAGRWTQSSRWLQFASYWFDVSVLEQFWSWSVGITVVGAPRDLVLQDMVHFINQANITHIDLTPSLARLLEPEDVPSLHKGVFITGGEALKQEIIEKWSQIGAICNGYGPTEATIGVTMNPFIGPDAKPTNIGPPFANVGSLVLEPGTDNPVLLGAIGELCVYGKLVGRGYLNRPDLTDKSFPFIQYLGERIYRTGDLVRQLADGSFLFLGRKDSQAKLRGQRLEIDEIDSIIKSSNPSIADVASLVAKSENKETLVSFLTLSQAQQQHLQIDKCDEARRAVLDAINACRNHLPGYMVPTTIVPISHVPLTVNNKVDAKALTRFHEGLPLADLNALQSSSEDGKALDEQGHRVAAVLSRMLAIEETEVDGSSNLFTLGLSSITAISFSTQLKAAGFNQATVATIMRNPKVGRLAKALTETSAENDNTNAASRQAQLSMSAFEQRHRRSAASQLSVSIEELETVVSCTPLQSGLILESMKDDESPYFNNFHFRLKTSDKKRLRVALQTLVDRVQVLRTQFIGTDEGYMQVVLRRAPLPIVELTCEHKQLPNVLAKAREQWVACNKDELRRPVEVIWLDTPTDKILTFHLHHALYDGISVKLMFDALGQLYHQATPTFGPKFTDALPFGPLQQALGAKQFWQNHLSDLDFESLGEVQNGAGNESPVITSLTLDGTTVDKARKAVGTSHQAVLQACFGLALHQVYPQANTYGMVVSGRSIQLDGADKVIGPLFNTIPVPITVDSNDTWVNLIHRCHDFNVSALPYQHTPLRDIKKWCNKSARDELFDTLFVFQNLQLSDTAGQEDLWEQMDDTPRAEYPLAFEAELISNGTLRVTLVARSNVADEAKLTKLSDAFQQALNEVAGDHNGLISKSFKISPNFHLASTAKPKLHQDDLNGVLDFHWTEHADIIRRELAQLAEVDIEAVNEHSTIFGIGLDSIDTVKLASRLKKQDLQISVSAVLQAQTIPRILKTINPTSEPKTAEQPSAMLKDWEQQLKDKSELPPSLDHSTVERILPATPNQEAMLAEMQRSDFHEYLNHDVLKLSPNVDIARLREAWQNVIEWSPVLRTSFFEVSNPDLQCVYAQIVHTNTPVDIKELTIVTEAAIDGVTTDIRKEVIRDFASTPPLRLVLARTRTDMFLILSLCHAQYDGHSLALLHQDVESAYRGNYITRPSADSAISSAIQATADKSINFWRSSLSGAKVHRVKTLDTSTSSGTTFRAELNSSVSSGDARKFCQQYAISMQSLAQTCWALVLSYYTGHLDVLFGVVLACRDSEEAEQVLFPMMNTVPMRASLFGTRKEMLKYIQNVHTEMLPHKQTPLRMIQGASAKVLDSRPRHDVGGLFDTLFIYQQRPTSDESHEKPLYESVGGASSVEYPVAVEMEALSDDIVFRAACKDHVLSQHGTEELLQSMATVMTNIVNDVDLPTLEFQGNDVSVCGLPTFQLAQDSFQMSKESNVDLAQSNEDRKFSAKGTEIREVLAKVSRVAIEDISPDSTIESMGIDSISAIKVASMLRKKNLKLNVSEIIRARTIDRMAALVEKDAGVVHEPCQESPEAAIAQALPRQLVDGLLAHNGIDRNDVEKVLPATAGQAYMLSVWKSSNGRLFYPTFNYRLRGDVSQAQLHKAWDQLIRQHSMLRTLFCTGNTKETPLVQIILKTGPESFHAGKGPSITSLEQPWAWLQVSQTKSGWDLGLKIHHALYDAVSLPLLMQDFGDMVNSRSPSQPPVSFTDFVGLAVSPGAHNSRREFWTKYLASASPLRISQRSTQKGDKRVEIFKRDLLLKADALDILARQENITTQSLLFAAYGKIYGRLSTKDSTSSPDSGDVVLGIYLSNRSHLENLLELRDPTINLVPLLVRSPLRKGLLECAREIQRDLQEIGNATNSAVALWEISQWTGVQVDTFVNFLKLPETGDDDNRERDGAVVVEEMGESRETERSEVVEYDSKADFSIPKELKALDGWQDVYPSSLDIEMTVSRGSLDVGIFVPEALLSLEGAERVMTELGRELHNLV